MYPFRVRSAPRQIRTTKYVHLKGVDMSSDPSQINEDFSPWCPNLISDNGGNPEKRPGWQTLYTVEAPVNGLWHARISGQKYYIAHGGTKLYAWKPGETPQMVRSGVQSQRSAAFTMNDRFWILTGREYIAIGLFAASSGQAALQCKDVTDFAYVPTVVIARGPSGGGTPFEGINLLSPRQKNSFLTTAEQKYQLSAVGLSSVDSVVLNGSAKQAGTDYTADLAAGTVTFRNAMPSPPIAGADNLEITFTKQYEGYAQRITRCTLAAGYGIGANDRIFFSGNPSFRNTDWHSGLEDPSYVPDTSYAKIGGETTAVMGYQRIGEYLAVLKEDNQQDSTIFLRAAQQTEDGEVIFPVRQGIAGIGAVSKHAFCVVKDEPLFLSRTGVYAITSNVVTAERTVKGRSYFIDSALTKEKELAQACAVEWNGYYVLCVGGGRVYLLDGNSPKENVRQYSNEFSFRCYHWEHVPARVLMEDSGVLWFGRGDGGICRFKTDEEKMTRYSDDGEAITAQWATKADDDGDFMARKTLAKSGSGVMIKPFTRSSVRVLVRSDRDCLMRPVRYETMDIWDWEQIDFARIGFNSNDAPQTVAFRTKVKNYVTLQIIVENNRVNEGFGVFGMIKRYWAGKRVR